MKIVITTAFLFFYINTIFSQSCDPFFVDPIASNNPPGCTFHVPIYGGNTEGFTKTLPSDDLFPCGTIENNQFISVNPDSTGIIDITFINEGCDIGSGIEVIFYDLNFNAVSPCFTIRDREQEILKVENLTPAKVYWMMIDGLNGSICQFFFTSNKRSDLAKHQPPVVIPNNRSQTICPDREICFTADPVGASLGYIWELPSNAQITSGGGQSDDFVCMTFSRKGFGAGSVSVILSDTVSNQAGFFVEINNVEASTTEIICPGDTIFENGIAFHSAGKFEVIFEDIASDDCDSLLHLEIKIPDTSAVPVRCFVDSFLNALTVDWDKKTLADFYEIRVNGSLISTQDFIGIILDSDFQSTNLKIEILPIGNHGCNYAPGIITCPNPVSSISKINSKDNSVSIFPNPSNGIFEVFSKKKIEYFSVLNFSGQKVQGAEIIKTSSGMKVNLPDFETGIYYLKIQTKDAIVLKKVLKI